MTPETIELKKKCLALIRDYDESIRALFAKIEPDLLAHARLHNEQIEFIDVDDISLDPLGVSFKISDAQTLYLPWKHFNINR